MLIIIREYLPWAHVWRARPEGTMPVLTFNQAGTCSRFRSGSPGPLRQGRHTHNCAGFVLPKGSEVRGCAIRITGFGGFQRVCPASRPSESGHNANEEDAAAEREFRPMTVRWS